VALLAGCSAPPAQTNQQENVTPPVSAAAVATPEPASPAKPFKVEDKSDLVEFSYSYPAEAAAVPQIVERLQDDLRKGRADTTQSAREDKKERGRQDFPFLAYSLQTDWTTEANTPRFLSLLSEVYAFTGGAHGNTGYSTLLWDRKANKEVAFEKLLVSPQAFARAIHDRFCKALNDARAEKRGEPVVATGDDDFTVCVDPLKQTLVPESKDGKAIRNVTVVIGPYEAGPYVEGSYEIDLPVDTAMLKAIKPEYRNDFAAGK
jgi:hypothetical protein